MISRTTPSTDTTTSQNRWEKSYFLRWNWSFTLSQRPPFTPNKTTKRSISNINWSIYHERSLFCITNRGNIRTTSPQYSYNHMSPGRQCFWCFCITRYEEIHLSHNKYPWRWIIHDRSDQRHHGCMYCKC